MLHVISGVLAVGPWAAVAIGGLYGLLHIHREGGQS
jgi:hypothetical protein